MKISEFILSINVDLKSALSAIERNHKGIIFFKNENEQIVGAITDGDIRRHLLSGGGLDVPATSCVNNTFIWAGRDTSREVLLKKLDNKIKVIPLLDEHGRLVDIVTSQNLPLQTESTTYARARAPVRVSFAGGGSDLTHYFAASNKGAVINATISIYSHAALYLRTDKKIIIHSQDIAETVHSEDLESFLRLKTKFGLIQALLKSINPEIGFELYLNSDFPMQSGLGGSSAVAAAVIGCFNQFRRDRWDSYEIAELAYQAERHYLGIAGGWQDQYATVFGGFNFIEFQMDDNVVHPLRIPSEIKSELEASLVLCNTQIKHDSNEIHEDQISQYRNSNIEKTMGENVKLSYEIKNYLLRGDLHSFAEALDKNWYYKRQYSSKISSNNLDKIYEDAKKHGAIGGKLLGAGGGGFFLFFVPGPRKCKLLSHFQNIGMEIKPFTFESDGLKSWSIREDKIK